MTSGNTYHYTTTTHDKPLTADQTPPLLTMLQIEDFNALQFQSEAKLNR